MAHTVRPTPPPPATCSLRDAAAILGISHRTVRRLAMDGTIRTVKLGTRRLVPIAELERVLGAPLTSPTGSNR